MTTTGADLLRMLGSLASPTPAQAQPISGAQASGVDFATLLKQASGGALSSGLGVTIAKGANVQLSADQMARIAAAADSAQAQGATRALVLIDGKAVNLDVSVRQITGQTDLNSVGVLTGIDTLVNVPSAPGAPGQSPAAAGGVIPLPRAGFASPSLLRLLGANPASAQPDAA